VKLHLIQQVAKFLVVSAQEQQITMASHRLHHELLTGSFTAAKHQHAAIAQLFQAVVTQGPRPEVIVP
jgi:hypothetical protein